VNEATVGVLSKCFTSMSVGHVQASILQWATVCLTIFCALVLYDYVCDMVYKSAINTLRAGLQIYRT